MSIIETNSTSSPITLAQMQANLRLPDGMDEDLLNRLIPAATHYCELVTNIATRNKTVVATYIGPNTLYDLKYKAATVTTVKINNVATTNFTNYLGGNPGYVQIDDTIEASDIVQITYTVTGITTHEALNECIIAYASALYNNPEGLSEMDMRRINFRLRTISQ